MVDGVVAVEVDEAEVVPGEAVVAMPTQRRWQPSMCQPKLSPRRRVQRQLVEASRTRHRAAVVAAALALAL